jgi:hypothetical protein
MLTAWAVAAACASAGAAVPASPIPGPPPESAIEPTALVSATFDAAGGTLVVGHGSERIPGARVDVAPEAGQAVTVRISSPFGDEPPLFPDLPLLALETSARAATAITIPYTDAFLSEYGRQDEAALGFYERRSGGLWQYIPSRLDAARNELTADVTSAGTWVVAPSWLLKAWQPPSLIGDPPATGARNVVVIHGWNASPWDACQLDLMQALASTYDHVSAFAYPSALDIAESAREFSAAVARLDSGASFDIVGFSEGGLVARAAIEPGPWNGGERISGRVPHLYAIATPHNGVLPNLAPSVLADVASEQMRTGSAFLRELNEGTPPATTRYIAVAGNAADAGESDGLVGVESALGIGTLPAASRVTLPLLHASTYGGGAGMPCDPAVYRVLGG